MKVLGELSILSLTVDRVPAYLIPYTEALHVRMYMCYRSVVQWIEAYTASETTSPNVVTEVTNSIEREEHEINIWMS